MSDDSSTTLKPYFPSELLDELKTRRAARSKKTERAELIIAEITKGTPRSPDPTDGALLVLTPGTETQSLDAKFAEHGLDGLDLLTIAADQDACIELERNRKTIKRCRPHVILEVSAAEAQAAHKYLPHYHDARLLGDKLRYFEPIELRSLAAIHGRVEGAKIDESLPTSSDEGSKNLNDEREGYLWLAAFVKTFRPNRILEIGRGQGNSLRALAHNLDTHASLDSFDIIPCGKVVNQANVETIIYDGKVESIDYESYDFVLVDLDTDQGLERRIYRKMKDSGFLGISVWTGILDESRPRLRGWWDRLGSKKLDISATNNRLGTGLIWFD